MISRRVVSIVSPTDAALSGPASTRSSALSTANELGADISHSDRMCFFPHSSNPEVQSWFDPSVSAYILL